MLLLKQNQGRNCKLEYEQLETTHKDLQGKFDKIKDETRAIGKDKSILANINETLRRMIMNTAQEFSEENKSFETNRLEKRVESMDDESKSLRTNLNVEYEQFKVRHKDLELKFDKIKYLFQAMVMDKTNLEYENEKLKSKLQKAEQIFLQKKSEISRLKKRFELMEEESKSLKEELQVK
ncbi:hypothetical protein CHS0354_026368 [Potamilus streckersoni]|uniref:Uncharacterized protein n=1 Tax=Potamilus streckersoni TaxID=2493646 RepID=A0AAE0T2X0_9BIVA|nr:hypothetical protein CHS0354_026368 [Potamilus streckersoni]